MKINEYTENKWRKISELADKVGCSSQYIWLLSKGKRKTTSPSMAARIEKATGGVVSRMELLFPGD